MKRNLLPVLICLTACAPSIEDIVLDETDLDDTLDPNDTDVSDTDVIDDGPIQGPDAQGVTTVTIDATDTEAWVYLDVDAGAFVGASDDWTLAFQRAAVMLNGGVSGSGGVEVAHVSTAFDALTDAPASGWNTDEADGNDDGAPDLALDTWFDYDTATHVLTPAAGSWAVRTAGGQTIAWAFTSYYDAAGTSAVLSATYKTIDDDGSTVTPDPTVSLSLDVSDSANPVYIGFVEGGIVATPSEPSTDLGWDLSIARTSLRVNGGYSGSGVGEAFNHPDDVAWEDVTTAPTEGYATDVEPPSPYQDGTVLSAWYNYDSGSHAVSASGRVHVVRDAAGDAWKLVVDSWDDGAMDIRFAPLEAP